MLAGLEGGGLGAAALISGAWTAGRRASSSGGAGGVQGGDEGEVQANARGPVEGRAEWQGEPATGVGGGEGAGHVWGI